ncbi:hypothetical protein GCM10009736_08730 [Actinomadura bangladeshensis]|uniref:ATP-binding cassette domain-containing protein n=1 Tax=Actinomadura bangladeshensis TaxID=453573 RepID=A0A4R4NDV3_9ACTN|nr:ATP-binding cassette domain-containing protein [Actinomadura bangladeshensis]
MDLEVPAGTIFSLLGPNGSGKTTTVRILSTLLPADGGEASVAGHDLRRDARGVRSALAVTGQFSAVDKLLTRARPRDRKPHSATAPSPDGHRPGGPGSSNSPSRPNKPHRARTPAAGVIVSRSRRGTKPRRDSSEVGQKDDRAPEPGRGRGAKPQETAAK